MLSSTSPQSFEQIKALPVASPERREAIRNYLSGHRQFSSRVAKKANVSRTLVSQVLHGRSTSAKVEKIIISEEIRRAR